MPLDESLDVARQVSGALETAHERGIVHRDLKPANINVTPDDSPTVTSPAMTEQGVILGTAAYMAPEQARGKAVDRRAGIWASGVVLFEMLTGGMRRLIGVCLRKDARKRLRNVGDAWEFVEEPARSATWRRRRFRRTGE